MMSNLKDSRRQRFYARQLFELQLRRAKGEAYQALFNKVMNLSTPGFIPMRPYGNVGDRKNDGYVPTTGTFYQVYAPLNPSESMGTAVTKAKNDFAGLHSHWNASHPIRSYRFAFNDEYSGSIVPLEDALSEIAKAHSIEARPFLAKDLEEEAFGLQLDELERAIDFLVPEPDEIRDADYAAIRDVITHVMQTDAPSPPIGKLLAPEFSHKIKFNHLGPEVGDLLRVAARQSDVVSNFFSNRSGNHRQDLRDHLALMYEAARTRGKLGNSDTNQVFFDLLESVQPPTRRCERPVQEAALIVMAYYFEACDIFEAPDASP